MKQKSIRDYLSSKKNNKSIKMERLQYLNELKPEYPIKQQFYGQTFQIRHKHCTDQCLEFKNIIMKDENQILNYRLCSPLPLDECACFVEQTIQVFNKCHILKKCPFQKQQKKRLKITKALTSDQRLQIRQLQDDGFKNSVISYLMNVTPGQVRMNSRMLKKIKRCTEDIEITFEQQQWIISECSKSTNVALFNAVLLLKKLKNIFNIKRLSIFQIRKLLHQLKISYRVPSLKPLQYFQKKEKNFEVYSYIESMCGYLSQGQKVLFIDECSIGNISKQSHKQWHLEGSFKQSFERNKLLLSLIAAIGDNFLCFQIIEETGKAYIFKHFCQNLLEYANEHYQQQRFALVLDNATIHKNQVVKGVLDRIPHVFTPPYRPDMNPIEHMFSWLKQYLVKNSHFYQVPSKLRFIEDQTKSMDR